MKKLLVFTLLLVFCSVSKAQADFEIVNTVLGKLETWQKEAQNIQEQLKEVQSLTNQVRQGVEGAVGKVEGAIDTVQGVAKGGVEGALSGASGKAISKLRNGGMLDFEIEGLESVMQAAENSDIEEVVTAYEEEIIPQYNGKNLNEEARNTLDVLNATRREDAAHLYALAFTTRTNLAKERKDTNEDAVDEEMVNGKDGLKYVSDQAIYGTRLLAQMRNLITAMVEFDMKGRAVKLLANEVNTIAGDEK